MKTDSRCSGRFLGRKGKVTLIEVSKKCKDDLHEKISVLDQAFVHDVLQKVYLSKNIEKAEKS